MRLTTERIRYVLDLNGDPCICGETITWHGECYANKTQDQIDAAYKRVWERLRREAGKRLSSQADVAIDAARKP